jgi:glycosyltransferase involved in cell wall biosynthesis
MRAAESLAFDSPVLWINNHSLARFALSTRWPVVYDITDDWLLAASPAAKRRRAELDDDLLMREAAAVVVCSPALAASRSVQRGVALIHNGVDLDHFSTPQPRPDDLGDEPVAAYVGTLHDERLDLPLCCKIAAELSDVQFVYVGPDHLSPSSRSELTQHPNVRLLGPRPYEVVPAYLQHADAIFIPHLVTPFTESLDPIKARECQAVGTPTVATAVAGFRDLGPPIKIASPEQFATQLRNALGDHGRTPRRAIWTWADAAREFRAVLESAIN